MQMETYRFFDQKQGKLFRKTLTSTIVFLIEFLIDQNRIGNPFTWMECSTWWIAYNSRTLAHLSRTRCVVTLSVGHVIHRLYRCRIDRKWPRYMGIFGVNLIDFYRFVLSESTVDSILQCKITTNAIKHVRHQFSNLRFYDDDQDADIYLQFI